VLRKQFVKAGICTKMVTRLFVEQLLVFMYALHEVCQSTHYGEDMSDRPSICFIFRGI
jgi:hypothetical protein